MWRIMITCDRTLDAYVAQTYVCYAVAWEWEGTDPISKSGLVSLHRKIDEPQSDIQQVTWLEPVTENLTSQKFLSISPLSFYNRWYLEKSKLQVRESSEQVVFHLIYSSRISDKLLSLTRIQKWRRTTNSKSKCGTQGRDIPRMWWNTVEVERLIEIQCVQKMGIQSIWQNTSSAHIWHQQTNQL